VNTFSFSDRGILRSLDPVLNALVRETHLTTLMPQMICSEEQGHLLTMLTQLLRPKRVLELGTFTGYSAICIARGLPSEGHILSVEANDELERFHTKYFPMARVEKQITVQYSTAMAALGSLKGPFEMVFLDADKQHYLAYYEAVLPLMPSGGLLLADNVLWHGQVNIIEDKSLETSALRAFYEHVTGDSRVTQVLLPIRDGLLMVRKN